MYMRGWLRQLRKDRGLTQREVAARLGICQSYYGYIETRGRQKKIDLPLLAKIAGVFQVPLMALVDIETSAAEDMEKIPGERS